MLVQIHIRPGQPHQHPAACPGARRAPHLGRRCMRKPFGQGCPGNRSTISNLTRLENQGMGGRCRHILRAMHGQDPRQQRTAGRAQEPQRVRMPCRIQTIEQLIHQQQSRPGGESARQQHQPSLAIGQCEKSPRQQRRDIQAPRQGADGALVRTVQLMQRDVRAMDSRTNDLFDAVIPAVAFIAILTFRTHIGDLILRLIGSRAQFTAPAIATHRPQLRIRPDGARDQLQQLRLPRTVGAHENPMLSWPDLPIDATQHGSLPALHVDALQTHFKIGFHGAHIGPNRRTWQDGVHAHHFQFAKVL